MPTVLEIENLSKMYRLGEIGTGTISRDLERWWARMRGKEDPFAKIGEVNDRTKAGGEYVWALKDINLKVEEGEVLGIIGKNGAGKSTLLKILSQITSPTTGRVRARGRIASLLEVGTGFHPELTGRENIYLNGALLGMTRAEITAQLDEIVEFAGVAKYLDTPVKRYSSGMKVRLGFAVAAHLEPEILVVDEVLAVGDAEFQKKAIGKMQDVSKGQGRTVLFVSHNMNSIKTLCSRGIVLKDGTEVFDGEIDQAVSTYLGADTGSLTYVEMGPKWDFGFFKLISAGVRAKGKDFGEPITRDDEIEFVFEYDYKEKVEGRLDLTLQFRGEEGLIIFVTGTGRSFKDPGLKHGRHTVTFTIQRKLINQGEFTCNLWFLKDRQVARRYYDIFSFHILPEVKQLGKQPDKDKGVITPEDTWVLY